MTNHVDIRFKSLEVKRLLGQGEGPVNVHNNSTIKSVIKVEGKLGVEFAFSCMYEPDVGSIKIDGDLLLQDTPENIDKAVKEWEKDGKNLPPEMAEKVHNAILASCIIEAVVLSREVHIPPPVPTPMVSMSKTEAKGPRSEDTSSYIR